MKSYRQSMVAFKDCWGGGRLATLEASVLGREVAQTSLQDSNCSWGDSLPPQPPRLHVFGSRREFIPVAICILQDTQLHTCGNLQPQPWRPARDRYTTPATPVSEHWAELLCQGLLLVSTPKPSKSFPTVVLANSLLAVPLKTVESMGL